MATDPSYSVIDFHQYGGATSSDRLLLFAARAKDIAAWAGIPRKGWRIRMLFQRWISQTRERQLKEFWERASTSEPSEGVDYVLGPTAIVVAMNREPTIVDGQIVLEYDSQIEDLTSEAEMLATLAETAFAPVYKRLSASDRAVVDAFGNSPLVDELPDVGHNYVLEFALQMLQMKEDAEWFINKHSLDSEKDLPELIAAMEALCRPALVVDGQHRLWGAQAIDKDVMLPVVALTSKHWTRLIYQFVVINEKAQKVPTDLLNDIFASSLTPVEQERMRDEFARVDVDIEERIAGVLAGREPDSPFFEMVRLDLPNPPPTEANAYISQAIVQKLIEGGHGSWGWRTNDQFFNFFIKPTFPTRSDWDDWRNGRWRPYWFAFWDTVRAHYTPRAKKVRGKDFEIWSKLEQSNLTKGVGLKLFQRFFMEKAIERLQAATKPENFQILEQHIGAEKAREALEEKQRELAIPADLEEFKRRIQDDFLENVPVRFFTGRWEKSLDDSTGHDKVLFQLREAFTRDNWRASGGGVFVAE